MKDLGIQKPFLQIIDTTSPQAKNYIGMRKIFTDYLTKLNVPFYDVCCPATNEESMHVRWNPNLGVLERFDGTNWVEVDTGGDVPDPLDIDQINVNNLYIGTNGGILPTGTTGDIPISNVITRHFPNRQAHNSNPIVPVASEFPRGYFTTTSPTAMNMFLDTATNYINTFNMDVGSHFEWFLDNTQGANTVTVNLGSGITVATPAITGGAALTVSVANGVACFRMICTSSTTMKIYRIH
jgi:hypothetical protein